MHPNWAAEHLLVIRTLMERSAIYRRALAPIVLSLGALGVVSAAVGWSIGPATPRPFVVYWSGVGLVGISASYLRARRQALRDAEPFWSAPTRRVTQALLPPLFVGFAASALAGAYAHSELGLACWIVPVWMALYGCAIHAAGFFMPRGMKLLGWGFILIGCGVGAGFWLKPEAVRCSVGHLLMGISFGALHLGYGIYLSFTERRMNGM